MKFNPWFMSSGYAFGAGTVWATTGHTLTAIVHIVVGLVTAGVGSYLQAKDHK